MLSVIETLKSPSEEKYQMTRTIHNGKNYYFLLLLHLACVMLFSHINSMMKFLLSPFRDEDTERTSGKNRSQDSGPKHQ